MRTNQESLIAAIALLLLLNAADCWSQSSRFFRVGDGRIHLRNERDGRQAQVSLFGSGGAVNEKSLEEIDALFNFPGNTGGEHISLRLLLLLDYFSDKVAPGKMIHLLSGYRSPSYNDKLKREGRNVARTSAHIDGLALDFYIDGVNGKELWETVRRENCCGIGHYGGNAVHLDSGRARFWEAATSKTRTQESGFNRRIYVSTEYDRYRSGEKVRFLLASVSDFNFGVGNSAVLVSAEGGKVETARVGSGSQADQGCLLIKDRLASRSLYSILPSNMKPGRYTMQVDFCLKRSEQMPPSALSNEIEIVHE